MAEPITHDADEHEWRERPCEVILEAVFQVRACVCGQRQLRRASLHGHGKIEEPWRLEDYALYVRRDELIRMANI